MKLSGQNRPKGPKLALDVRQFKILCKWHSLADIQYKYDSRQVKRPITRFRGLYRHVQRVLVLFRHIIDSYF